MTGPDLWVQLLAALADLPVEGGFVIAGGCVRDHALGLEPKDIDLCIRRLDDAQLTILAEDINEMDGWSASFTPINMGETDTYTELDALKLFGVIKATWTYEGVDYDLDIISRTGFEAGPYQGVSCFDWGILQCWFDPDYGIRRTPIAETDFYNRIATLTQNCDGLVSRSLARFARFDARNPNVLRPYYKGGTPIPAEDFPDV